MAIRFQCETCKRPINVKQELAGRVGVCPHCRQQWPIPENSLLTPEAFRQARIDWFSANPGASSSHSQLSGIRGADTRQSGSPQVSVQTKSPGRMVVPAMEQEPRGVRIVPPKPVAPEIPGADPIADAPDALWYVRPPGGGQFGPASGALFRQWMEEGRVAGDAWLWRQGWEDWQQAVGSFPDLALSGLTLSATGNGPNVSPTVSSPSAITRAAYFKARRRRTMWTAIGLVGGTVVVGALIFLLVYVVRRQGGV